MVHPNRVDLMITNDHEAIGASEEARKACTFRWKIEEYHRRVKQVIGIGKCQAGKPKAQRKDILTAILAWLVLHGQAFAKAINTYELKNKPLAMLQMALWRNPYTVFA